MELVEHPLGRLAAASARPVERRRFPHQLRKRHRLLTGRRLDQLPRHRVAALRAPPVERQYFCHESSFPDVCLGPAPPKPRAHAPGPPMRSLTAPGTRLATL